MKNFRSDLAVEAREFHRESGVEHLDGVVVNERDEEDIRVTQVEITNENGEKVMGKPKGKYITIEMPMGTAYDGAIVDDVSKVLAVEMSTLIDISEKDTVLVVGLGNWHIISDAVGPKVIEKIMVTRHLLEVIPDDIDDNIRPVCGITPGVLGITGIETAEIIKGIIEKVKPSLVIAVDSLASRRLNRINRTVQISTTGIAPGGGAGNKRTKLNKETLGIPVIAVGVPTVVHAATVANDTINIVLKELKRTSESDENFYTFMGSLSDGEKRGIIQSILNPYVGNLLVTPKDIDVSIESMSKIIANGLNISLQPSLTLEDINTYLS